MMRFLQMAHVSTSTDHVHRAIGDHFLMDTSGAVDAVDARADVEASDGVAATVLPSSMLNRVLGRFDRNISGRKTHRNSRQTRALDDGRRAE
jgi:hypothetical protein